MTGDGADGASPCGIKTSVHAIVQKNPIPGSAYVTGTGAAVPATVLATAPVVVPTAATVTPPPTPTPPLATATAPATATTTATSNDAIGSGGSSGINFVSAAVSTTDVSSV
mgnify:CR=1 FL=1